MRSGVVVEIIVVVTGTVTWLAGQFQFAIELFDHPILDHLSTFRINRVRYVRVQLGPSVRIVLNPFLFQPRTALIAEIGAEVVFGSATMTV